jgi:tRNA modification GTPase
MLDATDVYHRLVQSEQPLDPIVAEALDQNTIVLLNKIDLLGPSSDAAITACRQALAVFVPVEQIHAVSCETSQGMAAFFDWFKQRLKTMFDAGVGNTAIITQARHRSNLNVCVNALDAFLGKSNLLGTKHLLNNFSQATQ